MHKTHKRENVLDIEKNLIRLSKKIGSYAPEKLKNYSKKQHKETETELWRKETLTTHFGVSLDKTMQLLEKKADLRLKLSDKKSLVDKNSELHIHSKELAEWDEEEIGVMGTV